MSHLFDGRVRPAHVGLALAALSAAAAVHAQTTLYVDAAAPVGGDGHQWSTALRDLQDALFLANLRPDRSQPIQIKIAQGLYTPDAGTLDRDYSFVINSGVSLAGGFAGSLGTNPDENDPTRFVSVLSGDLLHNDAPGISTHTDNSRIVLTASNSPGPVSGLTIRGGVSAIQQTGSGQLFLSRCTVTDNISSDLNNALDFPINAIVSLRGAIVQNCVFSDNASSQLPILAIANTLLRGCTVAGNTCIHGTGESYTLTPISLGANVTLDACLIADNIAGDYGLYCYGPDAAIYNCTIVDNQAPRGGAAYIPFNSTSMTNCIVSRNASTVSSRQIEVAGFLSALSCFLDHGALDIHSTGGVISSADLLSGDPLFRDLSGPDGSELTWHDNDYRLAAGSPCIDHANTSGSFYASGHADLLGAAPFDDPSTPNLGAGPIPYLDLGAYEFIPPTPPACRADFNNSGALSAQDIFDFLSAWFALSPAADFNNSGTLNAQDIFDFLTAWFAGC